MELKLSAIIVLVLFLINSSFSVFYKNNIRGDVNAGDETKYTPIFVIKEEKNIEVVRSDDESNDNEESSSEDETANQPSAKTYNYNSPVQTETPQQQQETPPQETPQQQPEPTPPADKEPTPPADEGSDYVSPFESFGDDEGFSIGG